MTDAKAKAKKIRGYFFLAISIFLMLFGSYVRAPGEAQQRLLVAAEKMPDTKFNRAVVFVYSHDRGGAEGILLTKGKGDMDPSRVTVLHSNDTDLPGTKFTKKIGMARGEEAAAALKALSKKPAWSFVAQGVLGWGPGQLDAEIARGDWTVIQPKKELLQNPVPKLWAAARKQADMPEQDAAGQDGPAPGNSD